jgi:cob(I)alamin adenosyltransferase
MKIYTQGGDTGETSLVGGQRVPQDAMRVAAYGEVDELNATLGLARAVVTDELLENILIRTQHELFDLGAELATPPDKKTQAKVSTADIEALERDIDTIQAELPALKQFVLPAGGISSATLHFSRACARRAERAVVGLAAQEDVQPEVLGYLNRLSDLLFVMARLANHRAGLPETPWRGPKGE